MENLEIKQTLERHNYVWLDLIRGAAAMEVFLGHLRTLVFKNYWEGKHGFIKNLFYFITGFSHEAVIIFFVLSGFFITGAILRSKEKGNFSFLNYGIDRLSRLWIVLIPGLLLTVVIDFIGLHYFGSTSAYLGTIQYTGNINVYDRFTFVNFVGNIFFLQTIYVPAFGSNSPLWSLSFEFWYYILFPLILFLFWKENLRKKIFAGLLLIAIVIFIKDQVTLYFSIWLIGSALVYIQRKFRKPSRLVRNMILVPGLILFGLFMYKVRTGGSSDFSKDFTIGLLTAVLCYWGIYSGIKNKIAKRLFAFFSGLSYSLYVIHLPLCIFLCSLFSIIQKDWGLKGGAEYLFIAMLVFGLAIIFWYFFESRYIPFRAYLKSKILGKKKNIITV